MTELDKQWLNDRLDDIDKMMSHDRLGPALYQILSGTVRGPDTGEGKSYTTQPLRAICFPKTCAAALTGMMHTFGVDPECKGTYGTHHFRGHVNNAISYLSQIGRMPSQRAMAAKKG